MRFITIFILISSLFLFSCEKDFVSMDKAKVLKRKIICIDPGHGGTAATDNFRIGPTGEREEWIDLRVSLFLKDMLESKGAIVLITRTEDKEVALKDRAMLAVDNKADVFLSIHHNSTADRNVNFPIIYFHGNASENIAGVKLAKCLAKQFKKKLFDDKTFVTIASDMTIFPNSGTAVLRHSYGIPGVIGEASFFSNPDEEQRLKNIDYNKIEAEAYMAALIDYFSKTVPEIKVKNSLCQIPPFEVFQEAERAKPEALLWEEYFIKGKKLMKKGDEESLKKAYEYFTDSVKFFPDSYLARQCHIYRAKILKLQNNAKESEIEKSRSREHYVLIK